MIAAAWRSRRLQSARTQRAYGVAGDFIVQLGYLPFLDIVEALNERYVVV